jgi:hypothetical protein
MALIVAGASLALAPRAAAQNHSNYRIVKADHVLKTDPRASAWENHIWVGDERAWKPGEEQIDVTVSVSHDIETQGVYLRAYFFDADNHLVGKKDQPNDVRVMTKPNANETWTTEFMTPQKYAHGVGAYAQFTTPAKWSRAVIVFGDNDTAVARVIPGGDITDFDIPEKAQIVAGQ